MINHLTDRINLCINSQQRFQTGQKADQQNLLEDSQNKSKQYIAIYENQFKARVGMVSQCDSYLEKGSQQNIDIEHQHENKIVEEEKNDFSQNFVKDLSFETVPYDAHFLTTNIYKDQSPSSINIIVSNKSMPVRIYQLDTNKPQTTKLTYCTFNQHKPNSQAFLSPYEFSIKNRKVVGAGRKFFSVYDCQKIQSSRVNAFDRIHLSTVELLSDENTVLVGDFVGNIYQIDLRQENKTLSSQPIKPHLDAIFHVKAFESDENLFLSSARKDNFTYLFDRRNLSTFVNHFEFERNSNQRYGLVTNKDLFAIGSQDGSIYVNSIGYSVEQGCKEGILFQDPSGINVGDIGIQRIGNDKIEVFYSVGTRFYSQIQEENQEQKIHTLTHNFGLRCFSYNF